MKPARDKKVGEELIAFKEEGLKAYFHAHMLADQESAESFIGTISNFIPIVLDYFPQPSHISSYLMFMLKFAMSKLYEFKNIYEDESVKWKSGIKRIRKVGLQLQRLT